MCDYLILKNGFEIFFAYWIFCFVLACGRKTVPSASEEDYREDLSGTIPEIENYESPVKKKTRTARSEFREPYLDITSELEVVLDTIASINKDIPNLQYTILSITAIQDRQLRKQGKMCSGSFRMQVRPCNSFPQATASRSAVLLIR
jgi:hypothetical protein